MPASPTEYLALSAMITPALFMTADGSLIISTSNRMSRTLDRMRALSDLADALSRGATTLDYAEDRRSHVMDQMRRLSWRSDRIRLALTMLYGAFASFVGTSLALALDVLTGHRFEALPTGLAVVGVGLMLAACISLVREAIEALRSNHLENRFYHDLHVRREAERLGSAVEPAAGPKA